jgi:DNA-binding SARP family transcriptional activator
MVRFGILGPVEALAGEQPVAVGGPRQVALLAFLLVHANRAVSLDELIDALWGEQDLAGAVKRVQVAIARLRKALGTDDATGDSPLRSTAGGYLLAVRPGQLDAEMFREQIETGRVVLESGDAARAAELFREALKLWRGPPLPEVAYESFAQVEIRRLEELRLTGIEARVEADLRSGRHAAVIGELHALLAAHPTRERLAELLMLALYRCGRQADALEIYQQVRARLAAELGLEPGPALRALQLQILEQASSLEPRSNGELSGPDELPTSRTHERAAVAEVSGHQAPAPVPAAFTPMIGRE